MGWEWDVEGGRLAEWDGLNLERVAQLHMPVDSTALAQVLYPVLQPFWPPPLPQLAQKPPKCPPRSPCTPSPHLFCQHPSSLTTVPGFPAEGTFSSVSSLPPLLPTENIYSSEVLAGEYGGQPGVAKQLWNTPLPGPPGSSLHQLLRARVSWDGEQESIPNPHPSTPPDVPSNTVLSSRPQSLGTFPKAGENCP